MELRTLCYRAFDPDLSAMCFDNVLGDGEAETFSSNRTNMDAAAGRRVLNSIVEQIAHHFAKQAGVAEDTGKIPRHICDGERKLLLAGRTARGFDGGSYQCLKIDRLKIHVQLSRFDARQFQEIVSQTRQTSGMVSNDLDEVAVIFLVFEGAGEERFSKALYCGERGTELVGNVGDEVLSHLFQAAKVRNFVEDNDGSECLVFLLHLRPGDNAVERAYRRDGYREVARLRGSQRNLPVKSFFAGKRLTD